MPCSALTVDGKPCRSQPLTGTTLCLAHSPAEVRASVGFVAEAGKLGGRPARPREIELIQQVADEFKAEMRQVLIDGLRAEQAVVVGGNSKDAHVEMVPDDRVRLATLREILDRLHGKPRQLQEVSGPGGGPLQVASTFDLERLTVEERRRLLELVEKAAGG